MRKIDSFINLYSVSKTLRFKAIPVGKTQKNIDIKRLIEEDEERAEKYKKAKIIIDRYHIAFIDRVLDKLELSDLTDYVVLYNKRDKSDDDKNKMTEYEASFRKQIADSFKQDKEYKQLFEKALIEDLLPKKLTDDVEKAIIKSFVGFKTAFEGFNQNRANIYSEEEKSTSIGYRCINENLPRFISNLNCFEKIGQALGEDTITRLTKELELDPYSAEECFAIGFFNNVLSNKGIVFYNTVIGGLVTKDGEKIKGLNEYINLYNQQNKGTKLPLLKPLYKQVLSEYEGLSYRSEEYKNTQEMISEIYDVAGENSGVFGALEKTRKLFEKIETYNLSGIYIANGPFITEISKRITGDWANFRDNWSRNYDSNYSGRVPQGSEKYEENRKKDYQKTESFSLVEIAEFLYTEDEDYSINSITAMFKQRIQDLINDIKNSYDALKDLFASDFNDMLGKESVYNIKMYLDLLKDLEKELKSVQGSGKETGRDEVFYGELTEIVDSILKMDSLYNRVRNFVTKKPYSTDKFKLYFENPQFLGGWDRNKVSDYRATILRNEGIYYIAIIDKSNSKILEGIEETNVDECYEVLDYKLIPGASKQLPHIFFSGKGREKFNPSEEVLHAYETGSYKKSSKTFNKADCHKVIDYYKEAITHYEWNSVFDFRFSDTDRYDDISGFFHEVDAQGYKLSFYKASKSKIDALVESGSIYLFKLYNKDFSPNRHGTDNLHTMIFKQMFCESNGGSIKLCGGAELFYRKASINKENMIVHEANKSIKNKNPLNEKKESVFKYDLIKDRRYTEDQYEIHIPIQLNRTPLGIQKLNDEVRKKLANDSNPYIIGIDRGERNLIYICVIDGKGNIVEQHSLNEIVNEYKGISIRTDYNNLLSRKQEERQRSRQDWSGVENIKELKAGYISQVVHKICSLVIKYDAIIAMEDLNSGFKNSRIKVEKQVYQKFEKALIDKLNYLSDKGIEIGENGSVTRAFQLANPFKSFRSMGTQNGFIFYIPAWLTSKIDPVTGFADLIKPKYVSITEAQSFIKSFDGIRYNNNEDMFEFDIDYKKFPRSDAAYKKKWTAYTNGTRIKTFRNPKKNGEWDNEEVILSQEFKKLFDRYGIKYSELDMREDLCKQSNKQFYVEFISLVRLMLQMRNSITGRMDVDYILSPVKDDGGNFYDSRYAGKSLPQDADANGAYNIARKALWAIEQIKESDDVSRVKLSISNKEWLEFVQK